ncbi:MAG: DUF1906 domain-containing protein [Clostridia bacterium]|nr:DUF1906 domain-containing protein [Clostridia bacterium]
MSTTKGYDTLIKLTTEKLNVLIADSRHTPKFFVGRYLTRAHVTNPAPKEMTLSEVKRISAQFIDIVSIFENIGSDIDYFTETQGETDALEAIDAANSLMQTTYTPIYFAAEVVVGKLTSAQKTSLRAYFNKISTVLSNASQNPRHYKLGMYGPGNTCNYLKGYFPGLFTMSGNPQGNYSTWTIKQRPKATNEQHPTLNGVTVQVDFDETNASNYGGWQYHSFPSTWENYGNAVRHRKECSICHNYKYENHVPDSTGTRCTVCGFQGIIGGTQEAPDDEPTE